MSGYTVKELKKIIMNYKKSNCPAVSRARRDELLMMIKDLNINVDEREPLERKKKEPKKERPKMRLPKVGEIDLKKFKSMGVEDLDKFELIGGDDLIGYTDSSSKFLENIKKLYPYGYQNLKLALEALRKQYKKDKTFLNIDDYFEKELKKPVFFNKEFFKKFVKKEGEQFSKTILKLLFKLINKKFLTGDIDIPSEIRGTQGMVSRRISK
jgi:hypothetical protein